MSSPGRRKGCGKGSYRQCGKGVLSGYMSIGSQVGAGVEKNLVDRKGADVMHR